MSNAIIVGYDPRTHDHAPIRFGIAASRFTGAPLIIASVQAGAPVVPLVAGGVPVGVGHTDEDLVADCTGELAQLADMLQTEGVQAECRTLESTSAARALHEEADAGGAGLLVVGSSRHGAAERVLMGSTGERLIHGAPCPIAVVPQRWGPDAALKTIGVAYARTDEGEEAMRGAYALARRAGATLRVLTVVKVSLSMFGETRASTAERRAKGVTDVEGEHRVRAEQELRQAAAALGTDVPVEVDAFVGDPADTLIGVSKQLDLLVSGSRGYGPVRAVLLGSVSRRIAAEAFCPVIVLPRGIKASLEALLAEAPGAAAPA